MTIKRKEDCYYVAGKRSINGIISIIFGVIVMIFPKILNYLIGIYLIIVGIWAVMQALAK